MPKTIDLRSDTVTKPTPKMREAMAVADVGDDVYGEDPTVNRLEARAAEIAGKEAALFVPTGTMGNTIAVKVHTHHGDEVLCDARAHLIDWELSTMAWFSGCLARTVATDDGILTWQKIAPVLKTRSPHNAATTLIAVENTHNMAGGTVYPLDVLDEICEQAHQRNVRVHMDAARVFNAAAVSGVPLSRILQHVDTAMFCLSKGLGAPVGSMVVGTAESIEAARRLRKNLGGGMRQAGVLAAAGLIALEESPARLHEDHANAQLLAKGVAELPAFKIDASRVQTNIVIFEVVDSSLTANEISAALLERGVIINTISANKLRAVTHFDVTRQDCEQALAVLAQVVNERCLSYSRSGL